MGECGRVSNSRVFIRRKMHLFVLVILFMSATVFRFFRYSTNYFIEHVNHDERRRILELLKVFDQVTITNNLTYLISGGSLIGSFRHHGFIPWDDDVDVLMNISQKHKVLTILSNIQDHKLYVRPGPWKFYHKDALHIEGRSWRWPFIDICFYTEDATYVWAVDCKLKSEFYLPKNRVFPLRRRKFETLSIPTPCNPETALSYFDLNRCINAMYSHKYERHYPIYTWASVPCQELEDKYSFVRHKKINGGWNETLEFEGKTLDYEIVPDYC